MLGELEPGAKWYRPLPDGRTTYQHHKLAMAMEFVPRDRRACAVDVGAHVGLWAMQLERLFGRVECFEPVAAHRAIIPFNVRGDQVAVHPYALGSEAGTVHIEVDPESTGSTCVNMEQRGEAVAVRTLDSFGFDRVDLLKIDVEGYELEVVKGAVETLQRLRPVVVIEQKDKDAENFGRPAREALRFLVGIGMKQLRAPWSGDYFMGWR